MVGGKVVDKTVDSGSSCGVVVAACVEVAMVEAAVGCTGAEVRAAEVEMDIVEVGLLAEDSVAAFGANVLE